MQTADSTRGATAHLSGISAEICVARDYARRGAMVVRTRWRGQGGEIDLIARNGADLVFVEVNRSRTLAGAAERVSRRQLDRLCAAAEEYLAAEPAGALTAIRLDVTPVDGQGRVRVIENAFGAA